MINVQTFSPGESLLDIVIDEWIGSGERGVTLIFPNRRAITHLAHRWVKCGHRGAIFPDLMTMEGLVARLTGLEEELLCEMDSVALLFESIRNLSPNPFSAITADFSTFYPWGSAFLRTLDEMDREGVRDEAVQQLLSQQVSERSGEEFFTFLRHLAPIRTSFHEELAGRHRVTPGYRLKRAMEEVEAKRARVGETLVFVGPFALTGRERALIEVLGRDHRVEILLQHDGRPWPAMNIYGELGGKAVKSPAPLSLPPIELHAAASRHGMIAACREILHRTPVVPEETAVVMPDAALLVPFLHEVMTTLSVPYNVTMGYPLLRSPILTLFVQSLKVVEGIREGQVEKQSYITLLHHPLVRGLGGRVEPVVMGALFHRIEMSLLNDPAMRFSLDRIEDVECLKRSSSSSGVGPKVLRKAVSRLNDLLIRNLLCATTLNDAAGAFEALLQALLESEKAANHPLFTEFFQATASLVASMRGLIVSGETVDDRSLLFRMIRTLFEEEKLPFSGIPLEGLQVMGLLETRVLAFKRLFILNVNEGVLPAAHAPDPVLPDPFRKRLGMPGSLEREAIYKYHLFRLIEAAEEVHLFYVDNTEESRSHFVDELLYDNAVIKGAWSEGEAAVYGFPISFPGQSRKNLPRGPQVRKRLEEITFSSNSFDLYLGCPYAFAARYILGLEENRAGQDFGAMQAGTLLHRVLEKLYTPYRGRELSREAYESMKKDLDGILKEVVGTHGKERLLALLARGRITALLEDEKGRIANRARLLDVEKSVTVEIPLAGRHVRVTGRFDRVDERGAERVILDYKSGSGMRKDFPKRGDFSALCDRREIGRILPSTQFPLYAILLHEAEKLDWEAIQVEAVALRGGKKRIIKLFKSDEDRGKTMEGLYLPLMGKIVEEIYDTSLPFAADPLDEGRCEICSFAGLCGRPFGVTP